MCGFIISSIFNFKLILEIIGKMFSDLRSVCIRHDAGANFHYENAAKEDRIGQNLAMGIQTKTQATQECGEQDYEN